MPLPTPICTEKRNYGVFSPRIKIESHIERKERERERGILYILYIYYIYIYKERERERDIEGGVRKEARTRTGPAALKHNLPVFPSRGWRWGLKPLTCALVQMLTSSLSLRTTVGCNRGHWAQMAMRLSRPCTLTSHLASGSGEHGLPGNIPRGPEWGLLDLPYPEGPSTAAKWPCPSSLPKAGVSVQVCVQSLCFILQI